MFCTLNCWTNLDRRLDLLQRNCSHVMELPPYAVDVDERSRVIVSAVRQQNENSFVLRIDPTTRSRETGMTEAIGW